MAVTHDSCFCMIDFLRDIPIKLETIGVLDIGAMLIENQTREYSSMQSKGVAKVIGFEPVQSECDKLNETFKDSGMRFLPYFVGDGTEQDFNLTNFSMTASLLKPNTPLLSLFQNLHELTTPVSVERVQTQRLDDIPEIDTPIEFIKMDIQGAELQALQSAQERVLKDVLVVHTEVEWVPMYENQPLFSEIELFLRQHGFLVHRILGFGTRAFKPLVYSNNINLGHQSLWSDVVFVKDFTKFSDLTASQLLKIAVICHEAYKSFDLALLALQMFDEKSDIKISQRYQDKLLN